MMPKKGKALLLFSGGLDSVLAAKILEKQGIEVAALTFTSFFFDSGQAEKSARENKIRLKTKDISKKHLRIVKNPRYGRGSGMNPCVDCHLLMLKVAKKLMKSGEFDFLATGEVLGQRPMSQNASALELIERKAGLKGKILRPLCAKVLPETEYEKRKLVIREKLFGFSGRSRKGQIELAKKMEIRKYPAPAGGCVLTDQEYSRKLKRLFENISIIKSGDIALLRIGRHFWIGSTRIILGRNHEENITLRKLVQKGDILAELKNVPGPLALIRGKDKIKGEKLAKEKIKKYARKLKEKYPEFSFPKMAS
jgi:tRNA U34 2-thiouridine synthase MnmA/TrmU